MLSDQDRQALADVFTAMKSFSTDSCVRGYHVYNDIWEASVGEELSCQCEDGKSADHFAVAIKRSGVIVGHIPRMISFFCEEME